jgi:hypothetical protein
MAKFETSLRRVSPVTQKGERDQGRSGTSLSRVSPVTQKGEKEKKGKRKKKSCNSPIIRLRGNVDLISG